MGPIVRCPPRELAMSAIESTLETFNIETGTRRVIHRARGHFEAPNWCREEECFLVNSGGLLYRVRAGGQPERVDTGGLVRLNNDHGLSPDGRWVAVSDQSEPDGLSRIWMLPANGGAARLITREGPSYWHGWSPDGRTIAYVAGRGGAFLNIYAAPVEGGQERRLTDTSALDDGPDYSPDGRHIYFNSARSGNMKIWRIEANGARPEQLTFETDTRDWFPHPSPDGKWIVFLSFGPDVAVPDHPPNKTVSLRIMPATGGSPRALTTLFGGQGTINVPSWAPDCRRFAFVSYRLL
ncbi:MAG: TolB family protein [Alphaproteobacteria bacterium]|nr:TolB family protein [Alphaproteobacteria bacterium]